MPSPVMYNIFKQNQKFSKEISFLFISGLGTDG